MLTDTCPACGIAFEFAPSGAWHFCPACRRGRLRWVPDDLAGQLRAELAELEQWKNENIPGATEAIEAIRARLEREKETDNAHR